MKELKRNSVRQFSYVGFRSLKRGSLLRAEGVMRKIDRHDHWFAYHHVIPEDPQLARKLGLLPGQKLHFFAACTGEWASALANQGLIVHASDASERAIRDLKKYKEFASLRHIAAGYDPEISPGFFDWSVSFEPFPVLDAIRGVEDVARQGFANTKGMKLLFALSDRVSESDRIFMNYRARLQLMSEIYGATFKTDSIQIIPEQDEGESPKTSILMWSLLTNREARMKAGLDVRVERVKYGHDLGKEGRGSRVRNLSARFGVSEHAVRESLIRIKKAEKIGLFVPNMV